MVEGEGIGGDIGVRSTITIPSVCTIGTKVSVINTPRTALCAMWKNIPSKIYYF